MWTMGGQLGLPRNFAGDPIEGGVKLVPGWLFRMHPEISNLCHRRWGHGLVLLKILKEVCMVWCLKRDGIRLGG